MTALLFILAHNTNMAAATLVMLAWLCLHEKLRQLLRRLMPFE